MSKNSTTVEFIAKANLVHNFKYDYTKTIYKTAIQKVKIVCSEHGEFLQNPNSHLNGRGCGKCSKNAPLLTKEFILRSKLVHDNTYDYSKTVYRSSHKKLVVTCRAHGEFLVSPNNHLRGRGCPECKHSKGEMIISNLLNELGVQYRVEYSFADLCSHKGNPLRFDFAIFNNHRLSCLIEFDGGQHFWHVPHMMTMSKFKELQSYDVLKNNYCEVNNIKLVRIRFDENICTKLEAALGKV